MVEPLGKRRPGKVQRVVRHVEASLLQEPPVLLHGMPSRLGNLALEVLAVSGIASVPRRLAARVVLAPQELQRLGVRELEAYHHRLRRPQKGIVPSHALHRRIAFSQISPRPVRHARCRNALRHDVPRHWKSRARRRRTHGVREFREIVKPVRMSAHDVLLAVDHGRREHDVVARAAYVDARHEIVLVARRLLFVRIRVSVDRVQVMPPATRRVLVDRLRQRDVHASQRRESVHARLVPHVDVHHPHAARLAARQRHVRVRMHLPPRPYGLGVVGGVLHPVRPRERYLRVWLEREHLPASFGVSERRLKCCCHLSFLPLGRSR